MSLKAHKGTRKKVHIHARVDKKLVDWIDERVEQMTFKDRSHAINFALKFLKDNTFEAKEIIPITEEEWKRAEEGERRRGKKG